MSGNDIKEEHPSNFEFIFVAFLVSHLVISGKDINEEHPSSIDSILTVDKLPIRFLGNFEGRFGLYIFGGLPFSMIIPLPCSLYTQNE